MTISRAHVSSHRGDVIYLEAVHWPANCFTRSRSMFNLILSSYNPGKKSLGQYFDLYIVLSFVGSLLKQCMLFEIFLQFSLPPSCAKLKLRKNFGYTCPTLFEGWGEGLDLCELENAPERQRKAPECPKAFVHDFSLGSTADYAYMLDFNVVTAVKRGYPPTSITWAYLGLRCRPVEVKYFFEVIRWQVTSFQMIAGSSLIFLNSYEIYCVYVLHN